MGFSREERCTGVLITSSRLLQSVSTDGGVPRCMLQPKVKIQSSVKGYSLVVHVCIF